MLIAHRRIGPYLALLATSRQQRREASLTCHKCPLRSNRTISNRKIADAVCASHYTPARSLGNRRPEREALRRGRTPSPAIRKRREKGHWPPRGPSAG